MDDEQLEREITNACARGDRAGFLAAWERFEKAKQHSSPKLEATIDFPHDGQDRAETVSRTSSLSKLGIHYDDNDEKDPEEPHAWVNEFLASDPWHGDYHAWDSWELA